MFYHREVICQYRTSTNMRPWSGAHSAKVNPHGQRIDTSQNGKTSHQPIDGLISQAITLVCHGKPFSKFPNDVYLIEKEDLKCPIHVGFFIVGWPCQSHSCAKGCWGLDDPQSNLFWEICADHALVVQTPIHSRWIQLGECTTFRWH